MLNKQMKDAMNNEEPDMAQLGQRLNSGRSKVLEALKSSINEHIPCDLMIVLTDQENREEKEIASANADLENIVEALYELKVKLV